MPRTTQLTTLTTQDYWRAIVLYGNNVATYKIALATCLIGFAEAGTAQVTMHELAIAFFAQYRERLATGHPQLANPARKTVLERAVEAARTGALSEEAAIEQVARQGFGDVVPRFHTVNGAAVPVQFYEATGPGLVLTDSLLTLFHEAARLDLQREVASRWDLLEAAFTMHLSVEVLGTDAHMLYRTNGYERVDITGCVPVLNGYQNGSCFYCGDPLDLDTDHSDDAVNTATTTHVDHVIPRTFLQHDEIWNLVLAHDACNLAKGACLPAYPYLEKLYERNEYYIASNHPIKRHLLQQTGETPAKRRQCLEQTYREAERVLIHIWPGMAAGLLRANPLTPLGLAP
jgi:5-methylcytosine-specific restriction endonuclease McrA